MRSGLGSEAGPASDPGDCLVRRIAHDLATPVGALAIALELAPATDPLVRRAVGELEAILAAHRNLFGAPADAPFAAATLAPLFGDRELRIADGLDHRSARALGALALDAAPLLAGRGAILLHLADGHPAARLEGRARPPGPALAAVLAGAPAAEPGTVGAALAVRLLGPFLARIGEGRIELVASRAR